MTTREELIALLGQKNMKEKQRKENEYFAKKEKSWGRTKIFLHDRYAKLKENIEKGECDDHGIYCGRENIDLGWSADFAERFNKEENPIPGTKVELVSGYIGDIHWYVRVIDEEKKKKEPARLGWLFG